MFLIERFKFKYVSAAEMMAYDEKAGSPDAPEIKKCMDQKQQYPPELVLNVLRRFLSLYGPRKYLIEGFPRNEADVTALNAMVKQYSRVEMMGYINIELTEQQMRDSGVRTLKERKKEESEENIEKEVRTIIEDYRNKIKPVTDYYSAHSNFHQRGLEELRRVPTEPQARGWAEQARCEASEKRPRSFPHWQLAEGSQKLCHQALQAFRDACLDPLGTNRRGEEEPAVQEGDR